MPKFKSTEIPNGYVVMAASGRNILVDFDDNGKPATQAVEVSIVGWPDILLEGGKVRPGVLVLVHTVKGDEQMLLKRLLAMQMMHDGKPTTIREIARMGKLNVMAEQMWKDYMKKLEEQAELSAQAEGKS